MSDVLCCTSAPSCSRRAALESNEADGQGLEYALNNGAACDDTDTVVRGDDNLKEMAAFGRMLPAEALERHPAGVGVQVSAQGVLERGDRAFQEEEARREEEEIDVGSTNEGSRTSRSPGSSELKDERQRQEAQVEEMMTQIRELQLGLQQSKTQLQQQQERILQQEEQLRVTEIALSKSRKSGTEAEDGKKAAIDRALMAEAEAQRIHAPKKKACCALQ